MKLTIIISDKNNKGELIEATYSINTSKLKNCRANLLDLKINEMIEEIKEQKWTKQ